MISNLNEIREKFFRLVEEETLEETLNWLEEYNHQFALAGTYTQSSVRYAEGRFCQNSTSLENSTFTIAESHISLVEGLDMKDIECNEEAFALCA